MKSRSAILYILIGLCALTNPVSAQDLSDALRYSNARLAPSGESAAMMGANAVFGGDFYSASVNPACVGTFWKSHLDFGMYSISARTKSTVYPAGRFVSDPKRDLNLTNLSLLMAFNTRGKWKTFNFLAQLYSYESPKRLFHYSDISRGSITYRWLQFAEGVSVYELNPYEEGLAVATNALHVVDSSRGEYIAPYLVDTPRLEKQFTQYESTEMIRSQLAFGMNYDNRLYIGVSLQAGNAQYRRNYRYREHLAQGESSEFFKSLEYLDTLNSSATSLSASVGIIYRWNYHWAVSLYLQSREYWMIEDDYSSTLYYEDADNTAEASSPLGYFDYNLYTPIKIGGGVSYIFKNRGRIHFRMDYTDHRKNIFDFQSIDFYPEQAALNSDVTTALAPSLSFALGGEVLPFSFLRLRAGLRMTQSPYANNRSFYPAVGVGFGLNLKHFYIDVGYSRYRYQEGHVAYQYSVPSTFPIPSATLTTDYSILSINAAMRL